MSFVTINESIISDAQADMHSAYTTLMLLWERMYDKPADADIVYGVARLLELSKEKLENVELIVAGHHNTIPDHDSILSINRKAV